MVCLSRFSPSFNIFPRKIGARIIYSSHFLLQMSNGDMFQKNHDEIDFEFLGNIRGKDWRVQTNVYGNGSTNIGREERCGLWFDPAEDFHQYSILWTDSKIMYDAIYLNPLCHIWLLHFPCFGKTSFFTCPFIAYYTPATPCFDGVVWGLFLLDW